MSYKLGYIAEYLGADLVSASGISGVDEMTITGISNPSRAGADQVTFIASKKYLPELDGTQAAAIIVNKDVASVCSERCNSSLLLVDNPYVSYARLTQLFAETKPASGIHPSAVISDTAVIGEGCSIGANAVVADQAIIGDGVVLGPGVSIGRAAKIGDRSHIYANCSIYHQVLIGSDCIIHSGTVIGCDGFGFAPGPEGYIKIHQLGSVIIGKGVEIGANTSIDRGAIGNTEIHDGVKIDNLVHIAHNCIIGSNTAIAGQVGMAGTTEIGKGCTFGGQVGIAGHLKITDGAHVTGKSMVTKQITEPGLYSSGTGFTDNKTWRKNVVRFNQLDEIYKRIRALEKSLDTKD